jgi:hypothetical protein
MTRLELCQLSIQIIKRSGYRLSACHDNEPAVTRELYLPSDQPGSYDSADEPRYITLLE